MSKLIDLTGKRFGKLTVIRLAYIKNNKAYWFCRCSCGKEDLIVVLGSHLKNGNTKSCGCLRHESRNKKYNTYDLSGEYGIGYTSKGEEFYFDLEDYDKIKDYCWCLDNDGYVYTRMDNKNVFFHRFILNLEKSSKIVDNEDHITFNNQKYNLRATNQSNNMKNVFVSKNSTSGITGVSYNKSAKQYETRITIDGKNIRLGYYKDFTKAVLVRLENEEKIYQEFMPNNNRKLLSYIRNGGKIKFGDKELIQSIIDNY